MASLEVLSPCKLNLFLYITGKRPDGFHNLQSLFCLLDFGDTMSFEVTDDGLGQFSLTPDMGFAVEQNLIYKAVMLLRAQSGRNVSVRVHINKRIPMGGGLGGGSSNAATTLLVVNHLAQLGLSQEKLLELGAQLGSDVPFFVGGHSAFVEGRGEIISPLELKSETYLVVTPPCHVSTKEVFTDPELKNYYHEPRPLNELMATTFANDCVAVVRKKYCEIGHNLDRLVKYGHPAMSGTGASCFTSFPSSEQALQAQRELMALSIKEDSKPVSSFVAQSVNLSPVHRALSSKR